MVSDLMKMPTSMLGVNSAKYQADLIDEPNKSAKARWSGGGFVGSIFRIQMRIALI